MQKMKSSARFEFADSACDSSKAWKNPPLPGASPIEELIEDVRNGRAVILEHFAIKMMHIRHGENSLSIRQVRRVG